MPIRHSNLDLVLQSYEKLKKRIWGAANSATKKHADAILDRALFYVPKDTLALHDSGEVVPIQSSVFKSLVVFSVHFGGPTAPYAVIVHEVADHFHEPPTQAFFLLRAVQEIGDEFRDTLTGEINQALRFTP